MKRISFVAALVGLIVPLLAGAENPIQKGETLSLEKCVALALKNQPSLAAARSTADAARSRVGEAQASYYPAIEWTSDAARSSVGTRTSSGVQTGSSTYNSYSTGLTINQTIYDFGKTAAQVRIAKHDYDASLASAESAMDLTILTVKQAYYNLLQAKRNQEVAEEAVSQFDLHLKQAQGFFEVGTQPRYDVTKAQVDLSNAKLDLIKARDAVRLAVFNLNQAIGLAAAPNYDIVDNLSFEKYDITLEKAAAAAYQNRPDLKSIVAQRQAAESSISLAQKGFFPVLSGTAGFDYAGNAFPLTQGWNIGLTLSFPLFSGFLTTYQVQEAGANLSVLKANEESLRQSIFLDVQTTFLSLEEAAELVPAAKLAVEAAQENFDIADGSYAEGVGNPIQVADANAALTSAKLTYVQALYQYKVAQAGLEKAMGVR